MGYENYDVDDFVADEFFVSWILSKDPKAEEFWNQFIADKPSLHYKIEKARAIVLDLNEAESDRYDESSAVDTIWGRIDTTIKASKPHRTFSIRKIAATVSIVFVALTSITFLLWRYGSPAPEIVESLSNSSDYIEEVNTTGNLVKIYLADGSIVTLKDKSRLRYRTDFVADSSRDVYLTGEAFFDVAKNPERPFLVHTGEVTTKVLGTSFNVQAYDDQQDIVVSVKEGKVSVFSTRAGYPTEKDKRKVNGVVLTPNQQVVYTRSEDSFSKTLVEEPEKLPSEEIKVNFKFENTPVKHVFATLEEAYGVKIIFDEETMSNCFITVPLGDESLFEKMNIICRTIGATYEQIDVSLVVTGKGC